MTWKSLSGGVIPDIVQFVRDNASEGQEVHIGTDSLQTGQLTQFVTVVAIHNPPKGGRVVYSREVVARITSLRERLTKEVWHSVQLAMMLTEFDITVHIDANPNERYMSSKYVQELVGLVMGQGFKHLIKPQAWAASHAADHIVRHKGVRPPRKGQIRRKVAPRGELASNTSKG